MSHSDDSAETTVEYRAKICEIRSACDHPSENDQALYVKHIDGRDELVSSMRELTVYNGHSRRREILEFVEKPAHYWQAYNTIARFLMTGAVKLSGGRDCFKRLCRRSPPGAKTLHAGFGIYFIPDHDIDTYGEISEGAPGNMLNVAHLASATYDSKRRPTNEITLEKGQRYLVAGDLDDASFCWPFKYETMMVDREKLLQRGIEVPGSIRKTDLWVLDTQGRFVGMFPKGRGQLCDLCQNKMRNREWPDPVECLGGIDCSMARGSIPERAWKQTSKYLPALAEFECRDSFAQIYMDYKTYPSSKPTRNLKKVLDRDFGVRDWGHLSEITKMTKVQLAELFCSLPSLGRRLQKEGNSFVPWASDDGISFGKPIMLYAEDLDALFTVIDDVVVELYSAQKVRFEEENGVFHIVRGIPPFSERLPTSLDDSGLIQMV